MFYGDCADCGKETELVNYYEGYLPADSENMVCEDCSDSRSEHAHERSIVSERRTFYDDMMDAYALRSELHR